MAHKIVILFKRLVDHLKMAIDGKGIEHHGDSHLNFQQKFIHFWYLAWQGFTQNRCPIRASALAYTTLLALIPLLAVVASVSTSLLKSQGEKPIEFLIEKLVVNVAPQLDLVAETDETPKLFATTDFKTPNSLISKLRNSQNNVATYIWSKISEEARQVFSESNTPPELQRAYLAGEFNNLLQSGMLYEKDRFANIALSTQTLTLLAGNPSEADQLQINRRLLEEAFPQEIAASSGRLRVVETITASIKKINTGGLGVTGMLGLIFVAIMLLASIEATFNDIWGVTQGRNWLSRIVQYWATVTLGPLIPVMAIALNTGSQFSSVESWLTSRVFIGPLMTDLIPLLLSIIPFIVLSIAFTFFYQLMPNTRVRWGAALVGGVVGGTLWQLNSLLQFIYASKVTTYTNIYGPLSLVPIFLVGLYFSWLILLFGAQVAYTYQNRAAYFQEKQSQAVNELGREFVALRIMTFLAEKFDQGAAPPTEIDIGQSLVVPTRLVGDLLNTMKLAGLVHETEGGEIGYTVSKPLQKLTAGEILHAVRSADGNELETDEDSPHKFVRQHFLRIQQAEAVVADRLSLAQMIAEAREDSNSRPSKEITPLS